MPSSLSTVLQQLRAAPTVVEVLDDSLAAATAVAPDRAAAIAELRPTIDGPDELVAIAAVHALAGTQSGDVLTELLSHPKSFVREHASWALMSVPPQPAAVAQLVGTVVAGGFPGLLAQRTLARWGTAAEALIAALGVPEEELVRARLMETLGLTAGAEAGRALVAAATDPAEQTAVRLAAVAALGDRHGDPAAISAVRELLGSCDRAAGSVGTGSAGAAARLAGVARLAAADLGLVPIGAPAPRGAGLTVAQLFLHADLDRELSRAGAGDNGGIATLLVRLGDALVTEPGISRVLTLSRGTTEAAFDALQPADGHSLAAVPLLRAATGSADAWPAWAAARRGIRRLLRAHRVDLLHLRMAEVGSLAAAEAAAELGIPVVFTLAPDPHAAIDVLDRNGSLRREGFGRADEREHYWFRAALVRRLTADSAHVVLFPRPRVQADLRRLTGIDVGAEPDRYTVVPEGVDLAVSETASVSPSPDLEALVAALPADRHGLPLAISVGRLHPVKGMATLAHTWAADPALRDRCNLVIVGGDLAHPSADERAQLDLIGDPPPGLLLPGHRPNDVVARWLAAARTGRSPMIAPGGVYVCASLKEEFGLALLEALAAGLVVVGPDGGGPATYVEPGRTGLLTDTSRPESLGRAFTAALDLAAGPGQQARIARAQQRIQDGFTVQAMAAALRRVYTTATKEDDRP